MSTVAVRRPLGLGGVLLTGLLLAAAAIVVTVMVVEAPTARFGWDFRYQYFPSAQAVADGRPLYLSPDDPSLQQALDDVTTYVYPPQVAVALTPFTELSVDVATALALMASVLALLGTLAVVGVRDVRCYAAALAWWPTWAGLAVVNLTSFLALAVALAWRFRATVWPLAAAIGLAASTKIFLWPAFVWLIAMRRFRAAALGGIIGIASTLGAWAAIGFQGLAEYPALLRRLDETFYDQSYSIAGMAAALGLDTMVGRVLMLVVGGVLLYQCVRLGRQGDDFRAFVWALLATLALTPIVWQHYILLLLAPLAVVRSRFSAIWLLPIGLWVVPSEGYDHGVRSVLPVVVLLVLAAVLLERPRPGPSAASADPVG